MRSKPGMDFVMKRSAEGAESLTEIFSGGWRKELFRTPKRSVRWVREHRSEQKCHLQPALANLRSGSLVAAIAVALLRASSRIASRYILWSSDSMSSLAAAGTAPAVACATRSTSFLRTISWELIDQFAIGNAVPTVKRHAQRLMRARGKPRSIEQCAQHTVRGHRSEGYARAPGS